MTSPTTTGEATAEAPQPSYNIQGRDVRLPVGEPAYSSLSLSLGLTRLWAWTARS